MNEPQSPSLRSWNSGFDQDTYPGIENTVSGPPEVINPVVIPTPAAPAAKSGLPFNLSNLNDIKAIVDRMGGIEGVLSTMGKVQKFMSSVQQFAPMIKLFMGKKESKTTPSTGRSGTRRRRSTSRPKTGGNRSRRQAKKR